MLNNAELLKMVRDTSQRDDWRKQALDTLVANLAVDELYQIVRDTARKDSWRKYALDAICEIARLRNQTISLSSLTLTVGGASVSANAAAITNGVPPLAARACEILFDMVNDTARKDTWRYQCLRYLIAIGHKDYLRRIAENRSRKSAWRDEAMDALIHG